MISLWPHFAFGGGLNLLQTEIERGSKGGRGLTNQLPICPVLMLRRWMFKSHDDCWKSGYPQ